jgi:hypothetical protein
MVGRAADPERVFLVGDAYMDSTFDASAPVEEERAPRRRFDRIRPGRRLVIGAVAGVLTFSVVYGLAASLNLTSDSLGAATTTVAACQATTLNATYTSAYSASTPGYTVGTVTVTGLASTCYSKPYRLTLSGAAGASLGEATGTTPASGTSFSATFSPTVAAASVTAVNLVITG